jgi:hypothetical protein
MERLRDDPNENIFKTYGHITVNHESGEYIGHNLDKTMWSSKDLDSNAEAYLNSEDNGIKQVDSEFNKIL